MGRVYIIAEIGNTHEGSLGLAKKFVEAAVACGVDCVKFQTHIFDAESLPNAPNPPYFKDETRKQYFDRTAFTTEEWKELKRFTEEDMKVDFMSSPFSLEAVDLLEEVGLSIYKIPSGEVTNLPLLIKIANTGKKVLLSSGMSNWDELDIAFNTLKENGSSDIIVLQCTSEYPCPPEEAGLNVMKDMATKYKVPVGFSDHTLGVAVPLVAVVQGASVIEKHFTMSKLMYGSDAKNSTEPEEFKYLVDQIRIVEKTLKSKIDKNLKMKSLANMKMTFEKSIVAACTIEKGTIIEESHLAFKKPGDGISASRFKEIIGKEIKKSLQKDELLIEEYL